MRTVMVFILIILAFTLVACGGNDADSGAGTGDNGDVAGVATAIPSPTATPWPTLPPTNVPQTEQQRDHIYASGTSSVHIVEAGETLGQIANRYSVPVNIIANANRIYDTDSLDEGEILYIPPCD